MRISLFDGAAGCVGFKAAEAASSCTKKEEDWPGGGDGRSRKWYGSEAKQKKQGGVRGTSGIGSSQVASGVGKEVEEKPVASISFSEHIQG